MPEFILTHGLLSCLLSWLLTCRWEDTLKALLAPFDAAAATAATAAAATAAAATATSAVGGCSRLYEVGPGAQIKAMVRRVSTPAWKDFQNVAAV
jgi:hypothetical protein